MKKTQTINPNQLPEIETKDGKKFLRFQNNDSNTVLFCRIGKTALLIHHAEELFFNEAAQDWDSKKIAPAQGLSQFGETCGLDPVNNKVKPFELIPAPTAPAPTRKENEEKAKALPAPAPAPTKGAGTVKTLKKFKRAEWKALPIVSEPTQYAAQIRKDENGALWAWVTAGKYTVYCKPATRTESPALKPVETYGGKIPASLLAYCEKLNAKHGFQIVYQIGNEPENAQEGNRNSFFIYSSTVTFNAMECGTIHEDTARECIEKLKAGFTVDKPEAAPTKKPFENSLKVSCSNDKGEELAVYIIDGAQWGTEQAEQAEKNARLDGFAGQLFFAVIPEGPAPELFRKIRFQRGTDKTAGLVVNDAQFKKGFSELSRLFPLSECSKMQWFQFSPAFDSWEKAFAFDMDQGQGVVSKQVNP